jgi:hypothetical protein
MQVLETWSSPTHVKHSLLSKHHCEYRVDPFIQPSSLVIRLL